MSDRKKALALSIACHHRAPSRGLFVMYVKNVQNFSPGGLKATLYVTSKSHLPVRIRSDFRDVTAQSYCTFRPHRAELVEKLLAVGLSRQARAQMTTSLTGFYFNLQSDKMP